MVLEIKLLHNSQCHVWQKTLQDLKEVLDENELEADVDVIVVDDEQQAKERGMRGSPTIIINEKDVDEKAMNLKPSAAACRIYLFKGRVFEYPPKEMIEKALGLTT